MKDLRDLLRFQYRTLEPMGPRIVRFRWIVPKLGLTYNAATEFTQPWTEDNAWIFVEVKRPIIAASLDYRLARQANISLCSQPNAVLCPLLSETNSLLVGQ